MLAWDEKSLRKQFAQMFSACLLSNLKERGTTIYTNSSEEQFAQTLFIGVGVLGVDLFPLIL